jgi:hypothetical protein
VVLLALGIIIYFNHNTSDVAASLFIDILQLYDLQLKFVQIKKKAATDLASLIQFDSSSGFFKILDSSYCTIWRVYVCVFTRNRSTRLKTKHSRPKTISLIEIFEKQTRFKIFVLFSNDQQFASPKGYTRRVYVNFHFPKNKVLFSIMH